MRNIITRDLQSASVSANERKMSTEVKRPLLKIKVQRSNGAKRGIKRPNELRFESTAADQRGGMRFRLAHTMPSALDELTCIQ